MTAIENFWNWFVQHEAEFYDLDPAREAELKKIFDGLITELRKVDPDLVFEFGSEGTKREFVISAGGIKRAFPAVITLAKEAPSLERWQVTAFRPRRQAIDVVECEGKRIDPGQVQFSLLDNGVIAGIHLFIPGFRKKDRALQQIGYLLLDETLGEFDVETRLGTIEILSPATHTNQKRYPLAELPEHFDKLVARLEGRSELPS